MSKTGSQPKAPGVFREAWVQTRRLAWYIMAVLAAIYALSGIYSISSNELGVIQRMGRVINDRVSPGIHYAWPWPIDKVFKVPIKTVKRLEIEDLYRGGAAYGITGDNNLVNVKCVIQYNITGPKNNMFRIVDTEEALKNLACGAIIDTLALLPVDKVLTTGKQALQQSVKSRLQASLDELSAGVSVSFVEISDIKPPPQVERFFSEVVKAGLDRKRTVNNAESYRNQRLSEAKAQADAMIQKAMAEKKRTILAAQGETERFRQILHRVNIQGLRAKEMMHKDAVSLALRNAGCIHVLDAGPKGAPARLKIRLKPAIPGGQ